MTSKVERLRAEMLDERRWLLPKNPVEDGKGIANIDALISASHAEGVAEGAEQMANQVRFHGGHYTQQGDTVMSEYINPRATVKAKIDLFIVPRAVLASFVRPPASVLAPKPERGKPSQALLDELSEICGGEVTYDPTVLAPTKEKPVVHTNILYPPDEVKP